MFEIQNPKTWQAQEKIISTLEQMQVPNGNVMYRYLHHTERHGPVTYGVISSHLIRYARIFVLKLYCGYLYTRPCMINCIWGLKQLWLQVNGHAWFHLHEVHWAVRNRLGLKNSKWKYIAGFEPTHSAPWPVTSTVGSNQQPKVLWIPSLTRSPLRYLGRYVKWDLNTVLYILYIAIV